MTTPGVERGADAVRSRDGSGQGYRGWQQYCWGQTDVSYGLGRLDLFFLGL